MPHSNSRTALAAEYDTTVTAIVAHILERMPMYLKISGYTAGGPKRPVRGPAELAREQDAPRETSSATPPRLLLKNADFFRSATIAPTSLAESIASAVPLDAITAAVRQYDSTTQTESST